MASPPSTPGASADRQRSPAAGPIPPTTAASGLSDVFAFQPPLQTETIGAPRLQTSSSFSTEPPVVTPPTGLPLNELASFNGHQPTRDLLPISSPDTPSSAPTFASPPPPESSNFHASPPYSGTPSVGSPFGYRPPSTGIRGPVTQASLASSRQPHSNRESDLPQGGAQVGSVSQIQEGGGPSLSSKSSSVPIDTTYSGFSEEPEADNIQGVYDNDAKTERDSKVAQDPESPLSLASNILPKSERYLDDIEDSPYPEVRASVSNTDDVEMPCLTFRVWVIGILLGASSAGANIFLSFRYPAPYISPLLILLFAHPCGLALAWLLPIRAWSFPRKFPIVGGWGFSLNPSPWTIKEHALVLIMFFPAANPEFGLSAIAAIEKRYHYKVSLGFTILILLSSQLAGIGMAGLSRRLLTRPASFIWPSSLISCALLNTLHADETSTIGMSRVRFFCCAAIIAFLYYFLPGTLFTALSYFSFVCWIRPNNVVVNHLFGTVNGLGMGLLSFDWNQIAYIGSPLMTPFWAQLNTITGFVIFYWIIAPALYYSDVWRTGHLPIIGYTAYDRFAQPYDIRRVITTENRFNATAYEEYSPLYLPVTFVMTYLLAFALSTALLVHTVLYYGPEALRRLKGEETGDDDVHARVMKKYPEVPSWYYWVIFIGCIVMGMVAVKVEDIGMPVWAPLLALLIGIIYAVPMGYVYAMTGQLVSNNLVAEVIPGRLLPGSVFANMIFKVLAVQSASLMVATGVNLKIAHYIKCGERPVFLVQVVGALIGIVTQMSVKGILFSNVHDMCNPNQRNFLSCPDTSVWYSSSILWGLIGPTRQFGSGSIHHLLPYAALVGAILPVPLWLWLKRHPTSRVKYVHIPVLLGGTMAIPPAGGINYSSWFITGFIFQYWIRRTNFRWWAKYNYILSAALDAGTVLGVIVSFVAFQLPKSGPVTLNWWGNTVWTKTADFAGTPYYDTDPVEGF